MSTVNVKNNRDESITGNITITGDVRIVGKFEPTAANVSLNTGAVIGTVAVHNSSGVLVGYMPIYAAA